MWRPTRPCRVDGSDVGSGAVGRRTSLHLLKSCIWCRYDEVLPWLMPPGNPNESLHGVDMDMSSGSDGDGDEAFIAEGGGVMMM